MISRIQQDLFDFIDPDTQELEGLIEFWYMSNSDALSAALLNDNGHKIMINVSDFNRFEYLSKKLFLLADTIILRDTRGLIPNDAEGGMSIPMPTGNYEPGYYKEIISELKKLRPSPFTIIPRPELYWSSTKVDLNNGFDMVYAVSFSPYVMIPKEFIKWITSTGRQYLKTGKIVYAPFIPPFEIEQEMWNKHKVVLAEQFNASPFFETFEYFDKKNIESLLSIQFPYFENLDIETISKIKEDNYDEFGNFSRSLTNSIKQIKSTIGSQEFVEEIKYIKRNLIDDNLSKIDQKMRHIGKMRSLRDSAILTSLLGLNAISYLGLGDPKTLIAGATGTLGAFVLEHVNRVREMGQLKENNSFFLWKLIEESNSR